MNYRGSMVLVRAQGSGGGKVALDRIEAVLAGFDQRLRPNLVSSGGPDLRFFRFSLRLSPVEAHRAVRQAAQAARARVDAVLWVGPPGYTTFGDTTELSVRSLAMIISGNKRTCYSSLADYIQDGEAVPEKGNLVTVLNHLGYPALRYKLVDVQIVPFIDLPHAFEPALQSRAEIEAWQIDYRAYFAAIGHFDPQMPIVCERFRLVDVLSRPLDEGMR